ncbi:ribonuclease P protein component [Nocardioides sp. dk4132]|uniref:ribonuclease P protein component n=1 Tax=unclassified Nocardioides TaxID=2615069 RepID=UPI001294BA34|nr:MULTISPECIES: ribonuclease P protein component [unclassified Nocardioides]MQW77065.1 ribonuclease P protein component [Nocardioides sp. dk4132]QGA09468.1 ribonuclease P protein component [Nocardioides sp. dk884]
MLTRPHRLTDGDLFRAASRRGRRAGTRTLVVHLLLEVDSSTDADPGVPRVGFVVSKAVGNSVVRSRVKRRLRHQARERLSSLPGSAVLVVRALPAAAQASSAQLAADLDKGLGRVLA